MKKKICQTIVILFVTLSLTLPLFGQETVIPTVVPESVGLSSERLGNIDKLMNRLVDEKKIGGSVVLIARRGKIAYFNTFGVADTDKPMQQDTIFRIASMTKPLTSTAIMMLYEEGHLLLSDPVSKYIPEFKNPKVLVMQPEGSDPPFKLVPAKREITIRHLLSQTSGIGYKFVPSWFPDALHLQMYEFYEEAGISDGLHETEGTIGEMVKKLARLPLLHHPGEAWEYGLSHDVLGYVVEVVSGMSFDEFLQEWIFKPLNMKDTYFFIPEEKLPRLSAAWVTDWNGDLKKMPEGPQQDDTYTYSPSFHYKGPKTYLSGGAGLISTAYDYYRFCQMLANNGEFDGVRILSRKTVELMTATNHIGNIDEEFIHSKGWKFGLGFAIETDRGQDVDSGSEGVYEWAGIFSTRFSIDPKEEKITIMLTQTHPFVYHVPVWDKVTVLSSSAIID